MEKKKKDQEIHEDELKGQQTTEETPENEESTSGKTADSKEASQSGEADETEAVKAELAALKETNLRIQAEFQNYKRRTEKEKSEIYKYANEKIVVELLLVMDNLDRALESISHNVEDHQNVLNGVEMIKKSFEDLLEKEGVKVIEAVNQPFDPNLHHAVMTEEKDDCDADIVIEEFQKGYKLNDKVVRPAMVKVSC